MTEFLNSQVPTGNIITISLITAFIILFILLSKKMEEMLKDVRFNSYLEKHRLADHSTIFYKGEYWVVMKYLEKSYSIMSVKSKKTTKVNAKILISDSISQEKLLEVLAKADSFTEFYDGQEHLLKKYLDEI